MARYTGPDCKRCRREKTKLFLMGSKCDSPKCPIEIRPYPPGEHGRNRPKEGDYLQQILAVLGAATTVLARRIGPDLDRALRGLALAALEEQLHLLAPAKAAIGSGVTGHVYLPRSSRDVAGQTRRRFLGRQPLCGCGVTSWI